jgi:hypothetical protein
MVPRQDGTRDNLRKEGLGGNNHMEIMDHLSPACTTSKAHPWATLMMEEEEVAQVRGFARLSWAQWLVAAVSIYSSELFWPVVSVACIGWPFVVSISAAAGVKSKRHCVGDAAEDFYT